ncbi:MAG: nucleotide exchange factor GrpE [Mycobacteriales bacterium]
MISAPGSKGPFEESEEPRVVVRDKRRIDPVTGSVRRPADQSAPGPSGVIGAGTASSAGGGRTGAASGDAATWSADAAPGAGESVELASMREQLAERTADLQRLSAEYANYRKRVERDRLAVVELATAGVVAALLPIVDDIDRARDHGDLSGAFKAVAEQLDAALAKVGMTSYGEPGDRFDPHLHEAVMHQTSSDVIEPTCVAVVRRGYLLGDKVLRHALVSVAGPEEPAPGGSVAGPEEPAPDDETE